MLDVSSTVPKDVSRKEKKICDTPIKIQVIFLLLNFDEVQRSKKDKKDGGRQ